jgi:hypothetical protein
MTPTDAGLDSVIPLRQSSRHDALAPVLLCAVLCCAGVSRRQARQQASLQQAQAEVLRFVSDRRDHIPPVISASTVTFPFDIMMAG